MTLLRRMLRWLAALWTKLRARPRRPRYSTPWNLHPEVWAAFLAAFAPVERLYRSKMGSTSRGAGSMQHPDAVARPLSGDKYMAERHSNGTFTIRRAVRPDDTVSARQRKRTRMAPLRQAKAALQCA